MDIEQVVATIVRDHEVDRILEHHGVKGMKWGVRRSRDSMSRPGTKRDIRREQNPNFARKDLRIGETRQDFKDARKDAKWLRKTHGANLARGRLVGKTTDTIAREAQKKMKSDIKALNKTPQYSTRRAKRELRRNKGAYKPDPQKYPIAAKYHQEVSDIYMKHVKASAAKHLQTSPSGKWEDEFVTGNDYWYIGLKKTDQVSHSNVSDPDVAMFVRPVFDRDGHIVDVEFLDNLYGAMDSMAQSGMNFVDDILEHHGVKGMKWGVRRAPSAAIESARVRRAQNRSPEVTVLDRGRKLKTRGGRGHLAHPDAVTARTLGQKGKASGLKSLSNKELETYARRLQLEQNVTRLNQNEQGAGRKFLRGFMKENGNNTAKKVGKKGLAIAGKKAIMTAGKIALVA